MSVRQLETHDSNSRRYSVAKHAAVAVAFLLAACLWNLYILPVGMGIVFLSILLVMLLGLMALVYAVVYIAKLFFGTPRHIQKAPTGNKHGKRISAWWILLWDFVFMALSWYNIPRKAAFLLFLPQFTALEKSPHSLPAEGSWLGPWRIKAADTHWRGGLYIVTNEAMDMIDTISEGPTYKPNPTASPFGRAEYSLQHLHGNWYWFHANNDW